MVWYVYVAWFFAGVFLTNAIPHTVQGLSGNPFPTPFASPPGRGNSPPELNVIWGFFNLIRRRRVDLRHAAPVAAALASGARLR